MTEMQCGTELDQFENPSQRLNAGCFCVTLDRKVLWRLLERETGDPEFCAMLVDTRPHLFSDIAVFVSQEMLARMRAIVEAVERVAKIPAYQEKVLSWAPAIARRDPGPIGAFMGYDFHLAADGPKLIEINTNAGGAFLNAHIARAQVACCGEMRRAIGRSTADRFEVTVLEMFEAEWKHQSGSGQPRRIAIVDDAPETQYLYPEFLLAQRFFLKHGIDAVVADGASLVYEADRLKLDGRPIDLVYNRLVDFSLDDPEHVALRSAYLAGASVFTPNSRAHALFADKRNLTVFSSQNTLKQWAVALTDIEILVNAVPQTVSVTPNNAQELWSKRKDLFFKPVAGYGSKATYRGDKLTRTVWDKIKRSDYVAQSFVPPSERMIRVDDSPKPLKADFRLYSYGGVVFLVAARLYRGQTTNFRTPGGGFAPVFEI